MGFKVIGVKKPRNAVSGSQVVKTFKKWKHNFCLAFTGFKVIYIIQRVPLTYSWTVKVTLKCVATVVTLKRPTIVRYRLRRTSQIPILEERLQKLCHSSLKHAFYCCHHTVRPSTFMALI